MKVIKSKAFSYVSWEKITVPESIVRIDEDAFEGPYGESMKKSVVIESSSKKITPEAKAALNITAYVSEDAAGTRDKIHGILDNRFEMLNGNVLNTINNKLMGWK